MLDTAPEKRVNDLLAALDAALSAGEIDKAVSLFREDCYWRDLVAFTWNIKTMEGRDQIRDMLRSQLAAVQPSGWTRAEGARRRCKACGRGGWAHSARPSG